MKLKAAAKINLMLDILGKTHDGYHSLFMIMQSVGIFDVVTVDITGNTGEISLTCSEPSLPCNEKNIAYKAAARFFDATGISNPGIHIDIEKHIPFEAGLAGGSADAAAVLVGLNEILGADIDVEELCAIGVKVGADVPFCIKGGTMLAMDIGGVLAPLPPVRDNYYVLVKPEQGVSTKEAYDAFDTATGIRRPDTNAMLRAIVTGDEEMMYSKIANVFEQFVEVTDRTDIKGIMRSHGALAHCMSGSGPTVYGIFDNESSALKCVDELHKKYKNVYLCRPQKCGVLITEM